MLERNDEIIKEKMRQYILPGIMLTAALQIGNIVDTMLVGNLLGPDAMSAVKVGMSVDNIVEIPGYVLGVGGSVAAGFFIGNRETDKAKKVFSVTMTVSIILGIVFSLFSIGSGFYARLLCGDSTLVDDAERFIFVTLLLAPVLNIALQMMNYVAVDNNPRLASIYVITANVINLALDYILIKYTGLRTAGAALSTSLGYGLALILMIFYIKSKKRILSFVNPFKGFSTYLLAALKAGIPTLLNMVFLTIKDIALNSMIIRIVGETAMVIYTICSNATLCVEMFAGGIVGLLSSMGSVLYGKNDLFGIKSLIRHLLRYSYIALGAFMLIMLAKPEIFLSLFGANSPEIVELGTVALRIYAISLPFYLWNHFMMVYCQSTDKTVMSSIITSLQTCVAIVPLAFIFVFTAIELNLNSVNAMILSFVFSEIVTILVAFIYQRIKYKGQNYFMITAKEKNTIEFTVCNNLNDIEEAVKTIKNLCKAYSIEKNTSDSVIAVSQEMFNDIFTYGSAKHIDISVHSENNAVQLRLTDDGVPFNPLDNQQNESEDKTLLAETVKQIANRTEYLRLIDLNYSMIEINSGNK